MYAARFTRPDILLPISILATRAQQPTEADNSKLHRVLKYVAGTVDEVLVFRSDIPFSPRISADASHHLYEDGNGQMGMEISNGSAPVAFRSVKIRMATRSSSESELVSLEDASTYAIWYAQLLEDFGIKNNKPLTIYQDNLSTIFMASQGLSFKRNKHLVARESFVRERIENGDINLRHLGSNDMPSDIFTKPVSKNILMKMKKKLFLIKL
jgi:hypothetical protein